MYPAALTGINHRPPSGVRTVIALSPGAMTDRPNPLKLNPLQARTMAILQQLARTPGAAEPPDAEGNVQLRGLPHAHGDHFHLGDALVMARDATGLGNPAVFTALIRKGLVQSKPTGMPALTPAGLAYDTGMADQVLHRGGHH